MTTLLYVLGGLVCVAVAGASGVAIGAWLAERPRHGPVDTEGPR